MPAISSERRLNQIVTSFRDDLTSEAPSLTGAGDRFSRRLDSSGRGRGESDSDGVGRFAGLTTQNLNNPSPAVTASRAAEFRDRGSAPTSSSWRKREFALPSHGSSRVLADAGTVKLRRRSPIHRGGIPAHGTLDGRRQAKHWGLANHVVPKGEADQSRNRPATDGGPPCVPAISSCCATLNGARHEA